MIKRLFLAAMIAIVASPAYAHDATDVVELRIAPDQLNPAKAYLLFKSSRAKTGMLGIENTFLRVPISAETDAWLAARKAAYEAALPNLQKQSHDGNVLPIDQFYFPYKGKDNIFSTHTDHFLMDGADLRTFLIEVPVGNYVIYGISVAGRAMVTCNCLGTVAFKARAGIITDLGTLYADKVHSQSPLPQLESNVGPSMFRYGWIMGQALVPSTSADVKPEVLKAFAIEPAEYHAVGHFHDPFAVSINRLAPIPGILAYDHGKVIDVKMGTVAQ